MNEDPYIDEPKLHEAVGAAIMAWAHIEYILTSIFQSCSRIDSRLASEIMGTLRSFDPKLEMADKAVVELFSDTGSEARKDWKLLVAELTRQSAARNRIVHSTAMAVEGKKLMIAPFFNPYRRSKYISITDIKSSATEFKQCSWALSWFETHHIYAAMKLTAPGWPVPPILLRLRKERDQNLASRKPRGRSSFQ